jgi:hypothetical protein
MDSSKFLNLGALIVGVGVAAYIYKEYIYKPKVEITETFYDEGKANVKINGSKEIVIYSGSTYDCGFGWGVKFSPHSKKEGGFSKRRIELVKDHLVHSYLHIEPDTEKERP